MPAYRVRTVFTGVQGSPWLNTLWFDQSTGTAQQAANAAAAFWGTVDNRMATNVLWATEAAVYRVDETTGQPTSVDQTTVSSGAGSGSATQLPIQTQGLCRLRSGIFVGGREVRGRFYIPGLTENDNDLGAPNAGVLAVVNPALTTLAAGTGYSLSIFSRVHGALYDVTSQEMWTTWSSLKTRRD